jgi:hypothetical protein
MPYKRPYARGRRSKRGPAMSRYIRKPTKQAIQRVVASNIETKTSYLAIDELGVNQNAEGSVTPFNLISQGNQGNQRIGQRINPISLSLKMYFRPRGLVNTGNAIGDPEAQFDSACYSRIVIVRQKPSTKYISTTPTPFPVNSPLLLVGNGGTVQGLNNDYRDLLRKLNPSLFTVIYDKKFLIPMQYRMTNTKEVNINYRFPKSVKQTFSDNSEYPDSPVFMYIINRFVDDDTHGTNKTIEYSVRS